METSSEGQPKLSPGLLLIIIANQTYIQLSVLRYTWYATRLFSICGLRLSPTVTIWASMVQLLPQIIINRIGIILGDPARLRMYKMVTAVIMTIVCISVYSIWIPARMEVSDRFVAINKVWDRCEKVIYLLVDLFLNITYLHLVNTRLIAYGLTKYKMLFWFTVVMITISISMDVSVEYLTPYIYTGTN
jgi:hypothetical protein